MTFTSYRLNNKSNGLNDAKSIKCKTNSYLFSAYFTNNLKPLDTTEGQTVSFECQTIENMSDVTCIWFFNDNEIKDSEKYLTTQSGFNCQLIIREVKPIDSGVYQIRIGNISRRTDLKVQCMYHLLDNL